MALTKIEWTTQPRTGDHPVTITGNNITSNGYGITFYSSSYNELYHNNFVNNTEQVNNSDSTNVWSETELWNSYQQLQKEGLSLLNLWHEWETVWIPSLRKEFHHFIARARNDGNSD